MDQLPARTDNTFWSYAPPLDEAVHRQRGDHGDAIDLRRVGVGAIEGPERAVGKRHRGGRCPIHATNSPLACHGSVTSPADAI